MSKPLSGPQIWWLRYTAERSRPIVQAGPTPMSLYRRGMLTRVYFNGEWVYQITEMGRAALSKVEGK